MRKLVYLALLVVAVLSAIAVLTLLDVDEEEDEVVGSVSGVVRDIDEEDWSAVVGDMRIWFRGRYDDGQRLFYAYDMVLFLENKSAYIEYSEKDDQYIAEKVVVDNATFIRYAGRGE